MDTVKESVESRELVLTRLIDAPPKNLFRAWTEPELSPATSFVVYCETQAEVDYYWEKLSEGGKEHQCA